MNLLVRKDIVSMPGGITPVESWDERRMAVTAIWSTPAIDSDGDILDPMGFDLSVHRTNPIILFSHDPTQPIAKAMGPEGIYSVEQTPESLKGTAYFTDKNAQSYELFGLYAEGILRGWSVGFHVLAGERLDEPNSMGRRGTKVNRAILVECSAVAIGANQEALTVMVQKGRFKSPELLEAIKPLILTTRTWSTQMVAPIGKKHVVLQSILGPKSKFPTMTSFANFLRKEGYGVDSIVAQILQVEGHGDCWAAKYADPSKCLPGELKVISGTNAIGVYCEMKMDDDDDKNDDDDDKNIDDEQKMGVVKGELYKRVDVALKQFRKLMGDCDLSEEAEKAYKNLNKAMDEMLAVMDEDAEEDAEEDEMDDEEDEIDDEEAEKAITDIENKLLEIQQLEQNLKESK